MTREDDRLWLHDFLLRQAALAAAAFGRDAEQARGDSPAERPAGQRPTLPTQDSKTMTQALLPCPFCGKSDNLFIEPDEKGSGGQWVSPIHVGCCQWKGCGVAVSGDDTEEASAKWNMRAKEQSHSQATAVTEELRWKVARAISIPQHHTTWDTLTEREKDLFYMQADYAIYAMQAAPETGCYCIDRCMAPSVMGRQTRCLRNPPLRPGQVIEPPASGFGKAKP